MHGRRRSCWAQSTSSRCWVSTRPRSEGSWHVRPGAMARSERAFPFPPISRDLVEVLHEAGYQQVFPSFRQWTDASFVDPFPSLIIQDEAHLLEESLGTFSGLFDTLLENVLRKSTRSRATISSGEDVDWRRLGSSAECRKLSRPRRRFPILNGNSKYSTNGGRCVFPIRGLTFITRFLLSRRRPPSDNAARSHAFRGASCQQRTRGHFALDASLRVADDERCHAHGYGGCSPERFPHHYHRCSGAAFSIRLAARERDRGI